ncbi:MAG: potassium transporter TrkA [Planctomycetota bacterium]|nr:MAG: potassium transporter TrkA [Planctomycetota bacterium]
MQQVLIIGLGQFGRALATSLSSKGVEVLAVDHRNELVEDIAPLVADAATLDATDEEALARLQPDKRDVSICAIGEDSKEAAIICTALLRQLGAPKVIARAASVVLKRILTLVGAHEVYSPEEEFGNRLANRIALRNIISDMPLGGEIHAAEFAIPESFVDKTLVELELPKRFGVMVVAVRHVNKAHTMDLPDPKAKLQEGDQLVVVSKEAAIAKLLQES